MKYMRTWSIPPENIAAITKRFQDWMKTGGATPGIKVLGRWHYPVGEGFELLESDDHKALAKYAQMWSDLSRQKIVPVVDDQELLKAFGG